MNNDNKPSAIEFFLQLERKNLSSIDLGLPHPISFAENIEDMGLHILKAERDRVLQYSPPKQQLKQQIVKLMELRGVNCQAEEVFLCNGAQEGIFLLALLLLHGKKKAIVDEFFYPNFQLVAKHLGNEIIPVNASTDGTGMDIEHLEEIISKTKDIGCIYTVTNGHNPLSLSLPVSKRIQIAAIARQFNVPVIEDDPYGFIDYEEDRYPPLIKSFSRDHVYYVSTFSKILGPSLRVGWIIAPKEKMIALGRIKESVNINSSTFTQSLVSNYLENSDFADHIEKLSLHYKLKRDCMAGALKDYFPTESKYIVPSHGFFMWVQVPGFDFSSRLEYAIQQLQVVYIPGNIFTLNQTKGKDFIRLSFSFMEEKELRKTVQKLSRILL